MAVTIIRRGRTWRFQVRLYNPLPGVSPPTPDLSSPIPLTGYTAELQVRRHRGDTQPAVLTLTSPAGGIAIIADDGIIDVRASPTQTAAVPNGKWHCELIVRKDLNGDHDIDTLIDEPVSAIPPTVQ